LSLTKRQQLFVQSYCENPNLGQTAAAKAAGCGKRAAITACEWMRRPEIISEIQRRMQRGGNIAIRRASNAVTTESVLQDMSDLEELIKKSGMGAWQSGALLKIIEMRGKYLKMFTDRVEVGMDDVLIQKLMEGRKRAFQDEPPAIEAQVVAELPPAEAEVGN
jgi:phage terminase small subunit